MNKKIQKKKIRKPTKMKNEIKKKKRQQKLKKK